MSLSPHIYLHFSLWDGLFISHTNQREGIIWGITVLSLYEGEVLIFSSVYI